MRSPTRRSPRRASPMAAAASSPTCSSRATASRSTTSSSRSDGRGPGSEALRLAQPFVAVGAAHGQRLRLQVLQDGQFYLHPGAAGAPEVAIERLERAEDRKSGGSGKGVEERLDLGGRRKHK